MQINKRNNFIRKITIGGVKLDNNEYYDRSLFIDGNLDAGSNLTVFSEKIYTIIVRMRKEERLVHVQW